jgi:hypothetical protein
LHHLYLRLSVIAIRHFMDSFVPIQSPPTFSEKGRLVKNSLALIVAATSIFAFTQAADAQYYAPVPTTTYYAPATTTYYAPTTTTYYAPTVAYYPTSAYYAPATAYYGGSGYYGSGYYGSGYYGGYNRGGLFGTGLGGWAGLRGINRRWDRRGW